MNKKNTLKTSTALRWIALLLAAALFAGCSLTGETIRDRIDKFITAINNQDPQGIKDCLDPSAASYNTADLNFWNHYFNNRPYTIANLYQSGNTATVHFSGSNGSDLPMVFEMTENQGTLLSGTTYSIRRITSSSGTIFE
jgi:uncharacterized membrane protein YvbJ